MKEFTFVTTFIVKADDAVKARETVESVESQLRHDTQVKEHYTRLTDISDVTDEEDSVPPGHEGPHEPNLLYRGKHEMHRCGKCTCNHVGRGEC